MADAFVDDQALGYERSRTVFADGFGLTMDEAYRLAHLPLVAPTHPAVIAGKSGTTYDMGHHAEMFSLVLPVPDAQLQASLAFQALEAEMRAAPFADKIAWDIAEQRKERLHATVCGGLGLDKPPVLDADALARLRQIGPLQVQLRGLFSGNINLGRLYLCAYPEQRDSQNMFHIIQQIIGRKTTDLYVVGMWNVVDDLDKAETAALAKIIDRWWGQTLLTLSVDALWLLGAHDDLVLQSRIVAEIPLVAA